ncbi:MAG: hypothetical protein J0M35_21085 [Candidatus Obscuribacter phosphatis]|uniref:Tetratricopeptide repeat protein n=1 Tax=Candidatus Obscuribacter phosphatis TaxID=1906157 RepID=A0A8J7TN59_9BACT|nr:hypothetical protein [Candidatus Obscuribacter phosphatis]
MRKETTSTLFGEDYENLEQGRVLPAVEAEELERTVKADPWNFAARLKLIGFYRKLPSRATARALHLLWMIEHYPERYAWRQRALMAIDKEQYPAEFASARESWLRQVSINPSNPDVLGNAGLFLINGEFDFGKKLLSAACDLDEGDDFWPGELSIFCFVQAQSEQQNMRSQEFEDSLKFGEQFLARYGSEGGRRTCAIRERALIRCAQSALFLDKIELAEHYANEAIQLIQSWNIKPKRGLSVLGLTALRRGELEVAQRVLLNSNNQYTPDLLDLKLANELINHGEVSTVLSYLKCCQDLGLWQDRNLNRWIAALSQNELHVLS